MSIRDDFPMLSKRYHGYPFVYLDSAATSQKPRAVIDAMSRFYSEQYATVHRSAYTAANEATELYHQARGAVASFIGASSPSEVVFTRGTTDGLNIVAEGLSKAFFKPCHRILVSAMEHHSNLIPWQLAAKDTGAALDIIPLDEDGALRLDWLEDALRKGDVALVAVTHVSNVLGVVNPISTIARLCHEHGALLVVDGAQSVPHMALHVAELECDALCFSAHKMCGPTGIGVLWATPSLLSLMPPARGGSDMIDEVEYKSFSTAEAPLKFEPGTPPIAEAIGLLAAIEYLKAITMPKITDIESALAARLVKGLASVPGVRLIGKASGTLQSFVVSGAHPLDIAMLLGARGIAVRSGHMCAQPLLKSLGLSSVIRASVAFYNTESDIDAFVESLLVTTHPFQ